MYMNCLDNEDIEQIINNCPTLHTSTGSTFWHDEIIVFTTCRQ